MMTENRVITSVKLFVVIFAVYGLYFVYIYKTRIQEAKGNSFAIDEFPNELHVTSALQPEMKYILQWTSNSTAPFDFMGSANSAFIRKKCKYTNCFVTDNVNFMNLTDFDAVAFNGKDVCRMQAHHFPKRRSPKQKYIFGAMESSHNYPICPQMFDNYFNWTWTYKLDSDFRWGYITIYDTEHKVVGPAIDMKWPENMEPVGEDLKVKLSSKSKAAAWFVSHCRTKSRREDFVAEVQKELEPYGWNIDIFGRCGKLACPRNDSKSCHKLVEKDYYFYMSLENSFSEDYVTEKLLTALNNYAVPIVFGAANYSRFLPDGSYLDGRKLGATNLARVMNEIIGNKTMYHDFFRWRKHFIYKETSNNEDICKLCEVLNNDRMVNTKSVWDNFREWWNGAMYEASCWATAG